MQAAFRKIYTLQAAFCKMYTLQVVRYEGGALGSFKKGLQSLPKAVATKMGDKKGLQSLPKAVATKMGDKVETSVQEEDGRYLTTFSTPERGEQGQRQVRSHCVSLTSPGHATASILEEMVPEAKALNNVSYPCVYSAKALNDVPDIRSPA
ncbi:hypothetical protein T484DRAFT_1835369 [Baffinella frigidus]|nr:hypothetical protein T484DRAFT_1835369 [Cryptophyta sp. CCMP2293]